MIKNNNHEVTLLAETNFRGQQKKFGIKRDDRRRHMYVVGKTGMGKSVFMENMIIADIRAGNGVAVVDPHGDLVEKIIDFIPPSRINDVVYFNPADMEYPVAFNILEAVDEDKKNLVASGMMGVFKKIWPDVWSARMEYILNNTILALLDYPDSTMLGVNRMTYDKEYRKKVYPKIKDPTVKSFWINEFEKWDDRFRKEAVAAIQNKVGQFLSSFVIRNVVGQPKSTIDMREIMDGKKILLINLSKGRIGEDAMRLLGGMIITKLQLAAMGRVDIPEEKREDFYVYVDEFQNFATESFANILSEARKYHLNLIVAHQYIEQLSETVKPAVFGNVGTIVVFRVGAEDAEFLAKEFAPQFTENDFVNLTKYNVYMKLMIDGVASAPFSAVTLPPASHGEGNKEKIIKVSRERYAEPRKVVEEKIMRWSGLVENEEGGWVKAESESKDENDDEVGGPGKFESVCWACGKKTFIGFQPDNVRPIYCKQCLKKVKNGTINPATIRKPVAAGPIPPISQPASPISQAEPRLQPPAVKFVPKEVTSTPSHTFPPRQAAFVAKPAQVGTFRRETKAAVFEKKAVILPQNIIKNAEPIIAPPKPSISLSEAMKRGTVAFSHQKSERPERKVQPPEIEQKPTINYAPPIKKPEIVEKKPSAEKNNQEDKVKVEKKVVPKKIEQLVATAKADAPDKSVKILKPGEVIKFDD